MSATAARTLIVTASEEARTRAAEQLEEFWDCALDDGVRSLGAEDLRFAADLTEFDSVIRAGATMAPTELHAFVYTQSDRAVVAWADAIREYRMAEDLDPETGQPL